MPPRVAVVHDYLTQRGGAERVVLSMLKAFPGAPLHTSLYAPAQTFPEFGAADVRTTALNHVALLRRHHRLGLPLYPAAFSRMRVEADVTLVSSSGWAHGAGTTGKKIVYCHAPARWLYQTDRYVREGSAGMRVAIAVMGPWLRRWDARHASEADAYLANSTAVRDLVRAVYGIDAEILPPPHTLDVTGPQDHVGGLEPGFFLVVSRLLPYKNVDAVVLAFGRLAGERLVVVGRGPDQARLRAMAAPNTTFMEGISDDALRWLYANCRGLVAASHEDYGLTPLEAAAFGRPTAALRSGGFLDTVVDGITGAFFDSPTPTDVERAIREVTGRAWNAGAIATHADAFGESRFIERLRAVVGAAASSSSA